MAACLRKGRRRSPLWRSVQLLLVVFFVAISYRSSAVGAAPLIASADATGQHSPVGAAVLHSGDWNQRLMHRVGVFGDGDPSNGIEDDRQPVGYSTVTALSAVGTLQCWKPDGRIQLGSATLVKPSQWPNAPKRSVILTSAHNFCSPDRKTALKPEDCVFRPGNSWSSTLSIVWIELGGSCDNLDGGSDWAAAVLETAVQGSRPMPMAPALHSVAYEQEASFGQVGVAAHDMDRYLVSKSDNCSVFKPEPGDIGFGEASVLDHTCDTRAMASGGALYRERSGITEVIGVHRRHAFLGDRPLSGERYDPASNINQAVGVTVQMIEKVRDLMLGVRDGLIAQAPDSVRPE